MMMLQANICYSAATCVIALNPAAAADAVVWPRATASEVRGEKSDTKNALKINKTECSSGSALALGTRSARNRNVTATNSA